MDNGEVGTHASYGKYTIPSGTNFKQYYVSGDYTGTFGSGAIIVPIEGSSGNERFYIMKLEDVSTTTSWYHTASVSSDVETETEFGTGRKNTRTMIDLESGKSGTLWRSILGRTGEERDDGPQWFIPSKQELAAFLGELNISNSSNSNKYYVDLGLSSQYWSSTDSGSSVYYAGLSKDYMYIYRASDQLASRLATTF